MRISLATVHVYSNFVPLALLCLKANLVARQGLVASDVRIAEFSREDSPEHIAQRILRDAPEIVGLSCYVWNIKTLMAASRIIKERRPDIRIVLGGPEVGPVARSVLDQQPHIDCIVKGEGEIVFGEVAESWRDGGDLSRVRGLCFRRDGLVLDTGDAAILQDLNELAPPLAMLEGDPTGRIICIETQRGCVFRCNFCFYNKDLSIRNRRFDLDRVKAELLTWLQQDLSFIYLMDPVFNLNAARAKEILRFIAEHNHRRIRFHTEVWAEFIDEEMAQLMHAASFRRVEVGLQTTDQNVLAVSERRLKMEKFVAGVGHLARAGVPFELQLIFGLPGDTSPAFRESLNFAVSLMPPHLGLFPLMVLPGTELRRRAQALGVEFDPEPPYVIRSHYSMSSAEMARGFQYLEHARTLAAMWTFRLLAREPGVTFTDVVDAWMASSWAASVTWTRDMTLDAEKVRKFLPHFCRQNGIPPQFYEAALAYELDDPVVVSRRPREEAFAGFDGT